MDYLEGDVLKSHLCGRRLLPAKRSNGWEHPRDDKGEEVQGELYVPCVEGRRVREAVDDGKNEQNLPGEGLQEVAHGIKRKNLVDTHGRERIASDSEQGETVPDMTP